MHDSRVMAASDALTFRQACEGDLDRLIEIHQSAFPDPRGYDARRTNFLANGFGSFEFLEVCEKNGLIVAHAFLFPMTSWFGGARVAVGAIASVGVAPEARGQRLGSALLAHLHARSFARGDALTMLYAFRQGFYHRHGYGSVSSSRRLTVSPRAIPREWVEGARQSQLRRATASDREEIIRVYESAARRSTGFIVRGEPLWERRFLDERRQWLVVGAPGNVAGYVVWKLRQAELHGMTRLVVEELVAEDDRTRRLLFGAIGAQRDQAGEVDIDVADDDPIDRAFVDADGGRYGTSDVEHPLGVVVGGPHLRIHDPAFALEARGYLAEGTLSLDIEGASRLLLTAAQGMGKVTPFEGQGFAANERADITVDSRTLSSILYGALRPSDAKRLGWLEAKDDAALARADSLLALPAFFALDAF